MDKKELIKIVVTAAITLTFRELFSLILSFAKIRLTSDTTKAKLKKIFNETNINILLSVFGIGTLAFWLARLILKTAPITRLDVLEIVALVAGIIFWMFTIALILILEKITAWFSPSRR
jgi:hypothetical protein